MKICTAILSLFHLGSYSVVEGVCNEDDHHPENGGYFIEGINGFGSTPDPTTPKRKITNSTWAAGLDYPDGSLEYCTGMFCSETCRNDGCPSLIYGHTCSMIRFCYDADSTSDVWVMPDEKALSTCDFTEATQVCMPDEGSDDDCCNYMVEEDADLKLYLFASKNGCEAGQKAAVIVDDFDTVGDACYSMGTTSSRISKCTCNYEDAEMSTLSEPCHSQFVAGCNHHAPDLGDDTSCCETGTCIGHHMNYDHPIGKQLEDDRKELCLDTIPGRCLNTLDDSDDCCNTKCSQCGTDVSAYNKWATCTTGNATDQTATCGYGGHGGAYSQFFCDFSKCEDGHEWHTGGGSYQDWMMTVDPEGYTATDSAPVASPVAAPVASPFAATPVDMSMTCLIGTLGIAGADQFIALEGVDTNNSAVCNMSTMICDLSGDPSVAAGIASNCVEGEGKVITADIRICEYDMINIGEDPGGDIEVKNFPICMSAFCPDDTNVRELLAGGVLKTMLSGMEGGEDYLSFIPASFLQDDCPVVMETTKDASADTHDHGSDDHDSHDEEILESVAFSPPVGTIFFASAVLMISLLY